MRRFASPYPGYNHGTPKAGALPTALHPVIEFFIRLVVFSQTRRDTNFAIPGYSISAIISRRGRKSKIFLPVVKAAFVPFSATGGNPANAGVARLCGVSPHPIPDTTTALPKQARYQLRYTRIQVLLYRKRKENATEIFGNLSGIAKEAGGWYNGRKNRREDC